MSAARWLALAAAILYIASLLLPAIDGPGFPAQSGMDVLRQGASGWRDGVVAWYANPLFALVLVALGLGRFRIALGLGLAAALLALSSYSAGWAATAAGRSIPAFSYQIGFYLWLLAFVAILLAAIAGIYKVSKAPGRG